MAKNGDSLLKELGLTEDACDHFRRRQLLELIRCQGVMLLLDEADYWPVRQELITKTRIRLQGDEAAIDDGANFDWAFEGHCPGRPILPTWVLWAMLEQATALLYICLGGAATCPLLKVSQVQGQEYLSPVAPGDCLSIQLHRAHLFNGNGLTCGIEITNQHQFVVAKIEQLWLRELTG